MPHKTLEARREYHRRWAAARPGYGAAASRKNRLAHPGAAREDYLKHKAAYIARSKAWQARNPEKAQASKTKSTRKAWTEKRKEVLEAQKQWRIKNRPRLLVRSRANYKANADAIRKRKAEWRAANKDKISAQIRRRTLKGKTAEQDHRRRARLNSVGCEDCTGAIATLRHERFCRWCCIALTPMNFTIDHIVPLSRGGHHKPDNLAAACKTCNLSKGNKLVHEWTWEAA